MHVTIIQVRYRDALDIVTDMLSFTAGFAFVPPLYLLSSESRAYVRPRVWLTVN